MEIKDLFYGEFGGVHGHEVKKLIEEAYQTEVIEEHRQGSDCEWVDKEDEPREVRFKFRVPSKFKIDREKKLIVYGAIDSLSEDWGQMFCPDVKWGIKFVKDGKYSTELDYDQIEFQVYFWISYGS